ncbi:hypothetical protein AB4072_15450 [Microvirga sp. 2MCAF38]|uniref:hypothetical protein n=1 Tax=Microvirga sp. 2MCAF38 TaxID=3232989 RepID=UPI003F9AB118
MTKKVKTKLPKTVAGVKLLKTVRQGDWLEALLDSEIGRKVLADALLAAASAAANVLISQRPNPRKIAQAAEAAVKGAVALDTPKGRSSVKKTSGKAKRKSASDEQKKPKRGSTKAAPVA